VAILARPRPRDGRGGYLADVRARLHREAAEALAGRVDVAPAVVAYHFRLADGPAPEIERYSIAAAKEAAARLAYADAARHWAYALAAAGEPRLELVLELADARRRAGQGGPAREEYAKAVRLARSRHDAEALARAALGRHALGTTTGTDEDELVALLTEAAEALPRNASGRARVLAALARVLSWSGRELDRADMLADEAVSTARAAGDTETLGACLIAAHHVHSGPGTAARRLEIADEIVAVTRNETLVEARLLRAADLLELADPRYPAELDEFLHAAQASGQPGLRYLAGTRRATRALMAGRFDEAERLIEEYAAFGREIEVPDADAVRTTQRWELLSARGRIAELAEEMRAAFPDPDSVPWRGYQVLMLIESGERDAASALAWTMPLEPTAGMARRSDRLSSLVRAAQVGARLADPEACQRLYDFLTPYAGQAAVVGIAAAFAGAVDHHLGTLAAVQGREALARKHFSDALEIHERLGAAYWAGLSRTALTAPAEGEFRRTGTGWTLAYGGRTVEVKHTKGYADLAALLGKPGEPVSALELAGIRTVFGSDAVLDERAERELRQRYAQAPENERAAIRDALSQALGLGGRDRRLGDETERARKAVTARIRDALSRLDSAHPALAEHLRASITTGTWCAYEPATRIRWRT
jgi:hypothetical protein